MNKQFMIYKIVLSIKSKNKNKNNDYKNRTKKYSKFIFKKNK